MKVVIFFITCVGVFIVFDYVLGHDEVRNGVVSEKSYIPSSSGMGVGPSIDGNGGVSGGVSIVTTYTSEKYILFIIKDNGEVKKFNTNEYTWLKYERGDKIKYKVRVGRFTNIYLSAGINNKGEM